MTTTVHLRSGMLPGTAGTDGGATTEIGVDVDAGRAGAGGASDLPPLAPRLRAARGAAAIVLMICIGLLVHVAVVGRVQSQAAQQLAFADLRADLAAGTAPTGPLDGDGELLSIGTSIAIIEIPAIGLDQVVVEGTTPSALMTGPGHRRDTPFPGQLGTSLVFGRRAAFGAPFRHLADLAEGDTITVTHGQGTFEFHVLGVRREGDPAPAPLQEGAARLTLVTADGPSFAPNGALRVDADLVGDAAVGQPRRLPSSALAGSEQIMGHDSSTLWVLALWIQALIVLAVAFSWSWFRWGKAQSWIVFLPPFVLVGLAAAGELIRLLPNLL